MSQHTRKLLTISVFDALPREYINSKQAKWVARTQPHTRPNRRPWLLLSPDGFEHRTYRVHPDVMRGPLSFVSNTAKQKPLTAYDVAVSMIELNGKYVSHAISTDVVKLLAEGMSLGLQMFMGTIDKLQETAKITFEGGDNDEDKVNEFVEQIRLL